MKVSVHPSLVQYQPCFYISWRVMEDMVVAVEIQELVKEAHLTEQSSQTLMLTSECLQATHFGR